ncbi:oxidoreductase [Sinomonas cyclohexanicum]|uniref:Oxidoreductase n=1 Tax=Sinomonas cyclohexanicum TaxID=322009 RepID=A0ABN6FJL5_SINCY|nr:aldo/keto reductase [Corynebacterium cyclohexanicum]BCT76963.1 oxidoreductase [Corynebacterium cyclohexanicum]
MATAPMIQLASGYSIPQIGLGTWPLDDAQVADTVVTALELGYRHVDTAENYGNEAGVGEGLRRSGLPREELFITSKFNREWHSVDGVRTAWENAVRRIGVDYLDLYLIHWPNPDQDTYVQAWEGLIALREGGKVRSIGLSNFFPDHVRRVVAATGVAPDVDQLQISPYWTKQDMRAFNAGNGTVTESYTPIGRGKELLSEPAVVAAAEAHGVTPAQAVLRWHTQQGLVAIPKSSHRERLAQNLDVFGFDLTPAELEAFDALDGRGPEATDPERFGH